MPKPRRGRAAEEDEEKDAANDTEAVGEGGAAAVWEGRPIGELPPLDQALRADSSTGCALSMCRVERGAVGAPPRLLVCTERPVTELLPSSISIKDG